MRAFAEAWPDPDVIVQRFVGQLPWGQNITLLTKLKTREERLRYAARAVEHGWSRPLLTHHIELRTLEREGKAVTNFDRRLPKLQSDLARETLKDPYCFDFLSLSSEAEEREGGYADLHHGSLLHEASDPLNPLVPGATPPPHDRPHNQGAARSV